MQMRGAHRMSRDLVLDDGGAEHRAYETACATRGARADDACIVLVNLLAQLGDDALGGAGWVALRPEVGAGDDFVVVVDDDALRGNGADIDSDVAVHEWDSFFMASMS